MHPADTGSELARLLAERRLHSVFQPIARLEDGRIHAHEALIRGPQGHPLHSPDALLRTAKAEGLLHDFELTACFLALENWVALGQPGRLFVNLGADPLIEVVERLGVEALAGRIEQLGLRARSIVIELTEHERVSDMNRLAGIVATLRARGVLFALDDFGDGHSSLRLWAQIKPDCVKIDKYFTRDIAHHAENLQTVRALMQIAQVFDTELVAEGIETADDLRVLRDLGLRYGQGYFLGRPQAAPVRDILPQAQATLADRLLAVLPELRTTPAAGRLRPLTVIEAPVIGPDTSCLRLRELLLSHPDLHAVAVVADGRATGLINRQHFMNLLARPFFLDIHGRQPAVLHSNREPRLIEHDHDVDTLVELLTSADQRYLADGVVITRQGRYAGLATADQIVRAVTEARVEAARHANPLTFLPGNIPINLHIDRLLRHGEPFAACYADLNHFKPYNDLYGYWRGDEMIRLLARACLSHCDPGRDFVGHVGGDDFLLLMQSPDWQARCERITADFDARARELYEPQEREAGGVTAEDRQGVQRWFPLTTLTIGVACIPAAQPGLQPEDIANLAAQAKRQAKAAGQSVGVLSAVTKPSSGPDELRAPAIAAAVTTP